MKKSTISKINAIFILGIILIAVVPNEILSKNLKPKKPKKKDTSMEVVLSYAGEDLDFGTNDNKNFIASKFDYSGISYFIDGVEYFTDASGIIQHSFNDELNHTFTLLWHGVLTTFNFNTSINEAVVLETKDIEVNSLWNEVFTPISNMDFQIWYYNGISWSLIESAQTDVNGVAVISALVMGIYVACEVGDFNALNNFTVDQITTLFSTEIYQDAVKTIITVDYLNTIFGTDYPVDLASLIWEVSFSGQTANYPAHHDGVIVSGNTITYYNLLDSFAWNFIITGYAGYTQELVNINGLTAVKLDAKSLEAEFLWSEDSAPVIGMDIDLFWFNGTEFVLVGTYVTDGSGILTITEQLIIGTYKLNSNPSFDIVASDVVKTVSYSVESQKEIISISIFWLFYIYQYRELLVNNIFF